MPKLKLFRTATGFHDAYVAAPSRAAALRAWGADTDLFAMGAAEMVEDKKLGAAALAEPGKVIRVPRGSSLEHLQAVASSGKKAGRARPGATPRAGKPKPRPSRAKLDRAEAKLEQSKQEQRRAVDDFDRQIAALRAERDKVVSKFAAEQARLERKCSAEAEAHDEALDRWRAE